MVIASETLLVVFVTAIIHLSFVLSLYQAPSLYQGQEQLQGLFQYQGPPQYQRPQQYQGPPQYQVPQQYQGPPQYRGSQYEGANQFQGVAQLQGPQQYQGAPHQVPNNQGGKEFPLGPLQNISPLSTAWLQKQTDPKFSNTEIPTSNCSKQNYPTLIEMDLGLRNRTVDDSNSCYFACFLKELGFINEQGLYTAKGAMEHAKKYFGLADRRLPNVLALIDAGADCEWVNTAPVSDGSIGCDRAKLLFSCLGKANKAFKKKQEELKQPENLHEERQGPDYPIYS